MGCTRTLSPTNTRWPIFLRSARTVHSSCRTGGAAASLLLGLLVPLLLLLLLVLGVLCIGDSTCEMLTRTKFASALITCTDRVQAAWACQNVALLGVLNEASNLSEHTRSLKVPIWRSAAAREELSESNASSTVRQGEWMKQTGPQDHTCVNTRHLPDHTPLQVAHCLCLKQQTGLLG
jgi:hypothetical protein